MPPNESGQPTLGGRFAFAPLRPSREPLLILSFASFPSVKPPSTLNSPETTRALGPLTCNHLIQLLVKS